MKPLPEPTPEHVFPPNRNYRYFENATDHPFRFRSQKFEILNAWWLADAALLAYADQQFCQEMLQKAGFTEFAFLSGNNGKGSQCYVAWNVDFAIVAFRGTQVLKWGEPFDLSGVVKDVSTDAAFALVKSPQGGHVHGGFLDALDEVWDELLALLTTLKDKAPHLTLWFTGHSLGAALATLAAGRFRTVDGLYTYGSPFVGDASFRADFRIPAYRFVNNNDIVTRVAPFGPYAPPKLGVGTYEHVGQLKYIDSDRAMRDSPSLLDRLKDDFLGSWKALLDSAYTLKDHWRLVIPISHFNDHAPIFYALHIWNIYARELPKQSP